jgi:hypothetical protein
MKSHILVHVFILSAVACLLMAPSVMAQQNTPPTPESRLEQMQKAVKLTDEQKTKILKIYADAAVNAQQGGGRGGFMGGAVNAEIEKVLTQEQVKTWREYTFNQSVERRITQINEAVTLTDDQKKKITPIIEKEVKAQTDLMTEMRAQGQNADRQAMMDKMSALRTETDTAIAPLLTKEQLEKYNAMPRRGGMRRN